MMNFKACGAALATAVLLTACGGGGSDTTPRTDINSVRVFGDSLADVGTFSGVKATVQGAQSKIYPERVAELYGQTLCRYFVATGATTFVPNPEPGCTAYAIGGGRINNPSNPASLLSIRTQLETVGATTTYTDRDLLLIDGGGNDAADLVGAYLRAASDSGAAFAGLLGTLIDAGELSGYLSAGATGQATAGVVYMTKLADAFADAITTHALNRGATRVAVLNAPSITKTPRFQTVLNALASAAAGGGGNGPAARAQAEAMFMSWIEAYNTRLASRFAGNPKVVVIDFYTAFNDQVADPAQFGLTNATTPVCPVTGVGGDGLPTYNFATCTDTALSAAPPSGAGPDWWKTYAFADGFHPTPAAHQLIGQLISRSLSRAGWL